MEDQPFQDETPRGEDAEKGSNEPRPISEKKLAANQRNAQKSTGRPRTRVRRAAR